MQSKYFVMLFLLLGMKDFNTEIKLQFIAISFACLEMKVNTIAMSFANLKIQVGFKEMKVGNNEIRSYTAAMSLYSSDI